MEKIYDLRCNNQIHPLAIENGNVYFSFKVMNDGTSLNTSRAKIEIATSENFDKDTIYQKEQYGKGIYCLRCEIENLKNNMKYYYRISVWNQDNKCIGVSEISWFETGLGKEIPGYFICADYKKETKGESECFLMRREFQVCGKIKCAKIYATAKGLYELRLNGEKVGKDLMTPGFTNYHKRLQYQVYDVTSFLNEGDNVVGFILGDGWYKGYINWNEKRNWYGDHRAAWMFLRIEKMDGSIQTITTDGKFTWALSPIQVSEIYHGEIYDARKEKKGWDMPGFEENEEFHSVILEEIDKNIFIPTENIPIRIVKEIKPINIFKTPKGELLVDFGQNLVGNVEIQLTGSKGERVHIKHGEMLDKDGNFYCENIAPSKQEVEYILKGDKNEKYMPRFTFQAFRYIQILDFPGEPEKSNFTAMVWSSFNEEIGDFQCSDEKVNQLYRNTKWSQRGNFLDIPIAGPQRTERLGWTGDAQLFAKTACYHMDTRLFFKKWLKDLKEDQFSSGAVPWVVPNVLKDEEYECLDFFTPVQKNPTSAAWGDAALIIPWELYLQYGDVEVLEQQYESMKKYVEYMKNSAGGEEVFVEGFHYGDWFALDAKEGSFVGMTPKGFIATAYYAYSTSILQKVATILKNEKDANYYRNLLKKIKNKFIEEYVDDDGSMRIHTQTACVLALHFGLLPEGKEGKVAAQLVKYIQMCNWHISTGFVGTGYILHALSKYGYSNVAYRLLFNEDCPSWLYQVNCGSTTIWEHWDGYKPDGSFWEPWMNSFNHYAYGCVGDFLYSVVAGIVPDEKEAGYKHFYIKPVITKRLTYAQASLMTVYGQIYVKWVKKSNKLEVDIKVPFGSTATFVMPSSKKEVEVIAGDYHFEEDFQEQ